MTFLEVIAIIKGILDFTIFKVGETNVTTRSLITFGMVTAIFTFSARILRNILMTKFFARLRIERGTRYSLSRIVQYFVLFIGVIVAFQVIGIDLSGLLVIFGFLSVGIGFGLQNITSNFISGLILLFERHIRVGDRVTVGDTEGDVTEINIRSTTIRSLRNISIIVPNSEFISGTVVNWSHSDPKVRLDIPVGVSYSSDLDTVLRSLKEVAEERSEVLRKPPPEVLLEEFADSSWNMSLRVWINDPKRNRLVRSDINCAIVRKFRENNIEIPFPQRDLHIIPSLPLPLESPKKELADGNKE
ncbi:MAG TPA: mechanosensitive ion channel family protein [Nitrospiria bacterium]|nr:mechanosensitive ion channel family protein [Candidatus Manganitrophaceae bacterium]HIL34147.1 mechanosensitive ion channel family protein [Candidatus Manganitrophaceae bacterium]